MDRDGRDIVSVPISPTHKAILYEEDFDLLMNLGAPVSLDIAPRHREGSTR
jgi:hypothetical protein